jgi:hypothetical protein
MRIKGGRQKAGGKKSTAQQILVPQACRLRPPLSVM